MVSFYGKGPFDLLKQDQHSVLESLSIPSIVFIVMISKTCAKGKRRLNRRFYSILKGVSPGFCRNEFSMNGV